MKIFSGASLLTIAITIGSVNIAQAQDNLADLAKDAQNTAAQGDYVIVTGTRAAKRTSLSTSAPVDVITNSALTNIGSSELTQALSVALPSLNFPRPGLTDGTDTIRPAALRGLSPDQTLVLVNSKRRHASSLVNVNGSVGRGSAAVDLNTIPSAIVQSVEVLRDGASAQYGSDAIAGVVNIRLKEERSGGGITATYGKRITTVDTDVKPVSAGAFYDVSKLAKYDRKDGETVNLSAWAGIPIAEKGFLTVAAEYLHQKHTVRTAPDWRQQYSGSTATDSREVAFNRYDAWSGEPNVDQLTLFANAGYDLSDTAKLYGWLSFQNRLAESGAFFRQPSDSRNVASFYPDGFLPIISPNVNDASFGSGVTWQKGNWNYDLSLVGGYNSVDYTIKNTLNPTYGNQTKNVYDAGGFDYSQFVLNFSGTREYEIGLAAPLNVSLGLEARRENYSVNSGEYESYANGGINSSATPGSQGFPGFMPSNETDISRTSVAAYVDLETRLTEKLLVSGAARAEHYEDFGDTLTGKIAGRYDFTPNFAIRGSIQNGFRAPSLQQIGFAYTSTTYIDGNPFEVTTFNVDDPVARALGAKDLKAEKSQNYALGTVFRYGKFYLTIDGYFIKIDDRIVLSENLGTGSDAASIAVREYLLSQGISGAAGRFFINGVDTETKGVDIVAGYPIATDKLGTFNLTFGANFNNTDVTNVPTTDELSSLSTAPVLFGRVNRLVFEKGSPKDKYTFTTDWKLSRYGVTFRATRYGEVLSPGSTEANDLILKPKVVLDLEGRVKINNRVSVAIGADNITDVYPTKTPWNLNSSVYVPYSNYSPFGRSGRYVYGRVSVNW